MNFIQYPLCLKSICHFFLLITFWCSCISLYGQPIIQSEQEILLFRAIYESDSAKVEQLLQQKVSPNTLYFTNVTALGYAACKGKLGIVQALVNHGANVNALIPLQLLPRTALGIAVVQQNMPILEYLISKGAKIEVELPTDGWFGSGAPPKMYYSALTQAVMSNNLKAVNYLLQLNPEINRASNGGEGFGVMGKTPLMIAAAYEYEDIALALLNKGAKVNEPGTTLFKPGPYLSPLMEAALTGNTSLIKTLVDRGADVNAKDMNNSTALICAGARSKTKAAEFLLDKGAQINAVNTEGFNCLLASIGLHRQQIELLLSNRAASADQVFQIRGLLAIRQSWQKPDTLKYISELDMVIIDNDLERLLLGKDKMTERVPELNRPDFYKAHKLQSLEFTKFILSKSINIHQKTTNAQTAIQLAQQLNLSETIELLLNAGADESSIPPFFLFKMAIENKNVNKLNAYLTTYLSSLKPLEKCDLVTTAVCTENLPALRLLYSKGVKPDCADSLGISPLHNATLMGNEMLIDTLLAMGANKNKRDLNAAQAIHIANFINKPTIAQKVKPDSLYVITSYETARCVAETELKALRIKDNFKGGQMNDGSIYVYSTAIDKNTTIRSPLLAWLHQPYNDSTKLKYTKALLSRPFLVINPDGSDLNTFLQHQNYQSFGTMQFKGEASYKNGRNDSKSASFEGAYMIKTKEDKKQSWDAAASSMIEVVGAKTTWYNSWAFWVGTLTFAGAGGGWDNHCLTVVGNNCISFSKPDATSAWARYAIRGEYNIPKVTLTGSKYYTAFPGVKIANMQDCVPLKVIQNGQEKIIQPNKTIEFNRQYGNIQIIDEWGDKVDASGSGGEGRVKRSEFIVTFPSTLDIDNTLMTGVDFEERLKTYSRINSYRYWMAQKADSLSAVELYSLNTTIHLLSEKAKNKYLDVIKTELIGVVEFFENTQLKELNNALISLIEVNGVDKPEIINRLDAILQSPNADSTTKSAIRAIKTQVNDLPVNDVVLKLKHYKKEYLNRFYKKVDMYNLLLLEYCLYIPNEQLSQKLLLDRIPVFTEHLQQPTKERLKI